MADISAISGKALIDRQVMIQMLGLLEPTQLDEKANLYHVGYEAAKADLLRILGRSLGPEFTQSAATRLIRELRRDKGV